MNGGARFALEKGVLGLDVLDILDVLENGKTRIQNLLRIQ